MGIDNLMKSVDEIEMILKALDYDGYYINLKPYGEVKLSEYDLYPKVNDRNSRGRSDDLLMDDRQRLNSILMILNYSDGVTKLSEIAEKLEMHILQLIPIVELLKEKKLLEGPYFEKGEQCL